MENNARVRAVFTAHGTGRAVASLVAFFTLLLVLLLVLVRRRRRFAILLVLRLNGLRRQLGRLVAIAAAAATCRAVLVVHFKRIPLDTFETLLAVLRLLKNKTDHSKPKHNYYNKNNKIIGN